MYDVITFGSATSDFFVRSDSFDTHDSDHSTSGMECCFPLGAKIELSELVTDTGGGGTNSAATFGRLGYRTGAVTCIGRNDRSGDEILQSLRNNGVSDEFVQRHETEQTAMALIMLVGSGERTILVYRGASNLLDTEKIQWNEMGAKWFYVTSLGGRLDLMERILDHADRNGIKVAWNPGSRELREGLEKLEPMIRRTDVFNINLQEAMQLFNSESRDAVELLVKLKGISRMATVVTDGTNGAYATDGVNAWHSATIDVRRINVTGAGDAFGSGLVAGLLKNDSIPYGMAVGTWNATGVVQATGAKHNLLEKYPSDEEINRVSIEEIGV